MNAICNLEMLFIDDSGNVRIGKQVMLPFAPTPLISLGLQGDSELNHNELRIERVLWNSVLCQFFVRIQDCRVADSGKSLLSWYLTEGWRMTPELGMSREECQRDWPCDTAVEIEGDYYPMNPLELFCWKAQQKIDKKKSTCSAFAAPSENQEAPCDQPIDTSFNQ